MDDIKEILRGTIEDIESRKRLYLLKPNVSYQKVKYLDNILVKLIKIQAVMDKLKHLVYWLKIEEFIEDLKLRDPIINSYIIEFSKSIFKSGLPGYINLKKDFQ